MASIATLASLFGTIQKFLGIAAKEGLPDDFYQKVIDDPDFRSEFVAWAQGRLNPTATEANDIASRDDKNPYEMLVDEQILALRHANDEEGWKIPEEVFQRLAATAPPWPTGRYAFRLFCIRFGVGTTGVDMTFSNHVGRIERVFRGKFDRKRMLSLPGPGKIRLSEGNYTHRAEVNWVEIDLMDPLFGDEDFSWLLQGARSRRSLADELLVFAWMFPQFLMKYNVEQDEVPLLAMVGYEVCRGMGDWGHAPFFCFGRSEDGGALEIDIISLDSKCRIAAPARRS